MLLMDNSKEAVFAGVLLLVMVFEEALSLSHEPTCDLYLAASRIPYAGRGVVAGRDFAAHEVLELCPSLLVRSDDAATWQAFNYIFAANEEGYSMAVLGSGMMFNHFVPCTVEHIWSTYTIPSPESIKDSPYSTYPAIDYMTTREVTAGEELFVTYGDDWFESRGFPLNSSFVAPPPIPLSELQEKGHCLTNIYSDTSTIPDIGNGVFTKLAHKAGDVVSISPVLLLPKHSVQKTNLTSVILNYCVSQEGSDVALFPIGLGGMINHKRSGEDANVVIQWYDWGLNISDKVLSLPVNKLASAPFAQFDFAYVATRDIAAGEELFLDYGSSWEAAWNKYVQDVDAWAEDDTNDDEAPQFRFPIEAPADLFHESFDTPCIGDGCEMNMNIIQIPTVARRINLQGRIEEHGVVKAWYEAMSNSHPVVEKDEF